MNNPGHWLLRLITRTMRRYLVGPEQRWVFERPSQSWTPLPVERTSLYLHVPFCRHLCPYCPYTKVPYRESLVEPYTKAAIAELDWWANAIGPTEITSVYIWLHLAQNYFALNYVNMLWTQARQEPWPQAVAI